jgi:hypothetical protein
LEPIGINVAVGVPSGEFPPQATANVRIPARAETIKNVLNATLPFSLGSRPLGRISDAAPVGNVCPVHLLHT